MVICPFNFVFLDARQRIYLFRQKYFGNPLFYILGITLNKK